MEKNCARRMSQVYQSSNRSNTRENNLLSNYFNLPLVNLNKPSPTPIPKPLRITGQLLVRESFGTSQLLESENNTPSQESSILKINDEFTPQNNRIISKYVTNKQKELNDYVNQQTSYQRSKSIKLGDEEEQQRINNVKQLRRGSLIKNYEHHIDYQKQKTDSRLHSNRDISSTLDTPIGNKNAKACMNEIFNWDDAMNDNQNKISLLKATALLGKSSPIQEYEFVLREKQSYNKRQYKQQKLYKKLRILFFFVKAAMRISKSLRQSQKRKATEHKNLAKLREPHQNFINFYGQKNIIGEHKKFLMMVSNKILHYFEDKKYIQECVQSWSKIGEIDKDTRKTRFCAFAQMFLSNLELLTRVENMPELISHQLNTCLFKSKESQISQFVSKRAKLFSQKITNLSQNEKILIAADFFFFEILAPTFINLINDFKNQIPAHKNQNLVYCFGIISLLQMTFVNHFKNMPLIQNANVRPIQRVVSIKTDEITGLMSAKLDIIDSLERDELKIIFGCFNNDSITSIISEKQKWSDMIEKTFNKIISNLWCHIQI